MPVIVVWFSQWTIKQNEEILQQNDELNQKSQSGANYGYNAILKKTNLKLFTDHCLPIL